MTIMDKEDKDLISNTKKKKIKVKKNKKQPILFYKILSFILIILSVVTVGYVIYQEIFSLFYMIPLIIVVIIILFIITYILNKNRLRAWVKNIFSLFAILFIIFDVMMLFFGTSTLKFLSTITDTGYRVETFGVYVLSDSKYDSLDDLEDKSIYYLNHEDDKNIRKALSNIEKEIDIDSDYSDTVNELINSLIDEEVEAILLDTSYESILQEEYNDKYNKIKLIEEIDIVDMVNTIKSDVDITKDPFIVYVSGIDTSGNVASKARSDVNILIAVNPETKNILMINTPRDYYITLSSKGKKDKLTHAGLYGIEESLNSLALLYDADIDYYARVNFTSFIKMVDALDGVSVDVPIKFCEQDSKRSKAKEDLICLNKGVQTLDGEEALALARHRHTLATGDRGRGQNQMLILEAVINKALSPKIITKYSSLISALQGRVTTNMTTNEMYKFAKKQVKNTRDWKFTSMSANGIDSSGVCYSAGSGKAYVMEPDKESVEDIKLAIDNLFDDKENIMEGLENN